MFNAIGKSERAFSKGPIPLWVVIVLGLVYLASPIDLIPDFIPVAGQLDDLAVLVAAGVSVFKKCTASA